MIRYNTVKSHKSKSVKKIFDCTNKLFTYHSSVIIYLRVLFFYWNVFESYRLELFCLQTDFKCYPPKYFECID